MFMLCNSFIKHHRHIGRKIITAGIIAHKLEHVIRLWDLSASSISLLKSPSIFQQCGNEPEWKSYHKPRAKNVNYETKSFHLNHFIMCPSEAKWIASEKAFLLLVYIKDQNVISQLDPGWGCDCKLFLDWLVLITSPSRLGYCNMNKRLCWNRYMWYHNQFDIFT